MNQAINHPALPMLTPAQEAEIRLVPHYCDDWNHEDQNEGPWRCRKKLELIRASVAGVSGMFLHCPKHGHTTFERATIHKIDVRIVEVLDVRENVEKTMQRLNALDDDVGAKITDYKVEMESLSLTVPIPITDVIVWDKHKGNWDFWVKESLGEGGKPYRVTDMRRASRVEFLNDLHHRLTHLTSSGQVCPIATLVYDHLQTLVKRRESVLGKFVA